MYSSYNKPNIFLKVDSVPKATPVKESLTNGTSTSGQISTEMSDSLWIYSPSKCSMRKAEKYLIECEKIRMDASPAAAFPLIASRPPATVPAELADDENALYALLKADYDTEKAKKNAPFPWSNLESVNG